MSSGMQISKADIEECQEIVNNFRVNELHLLLTTYHYPKLGKKLDLVQRAKSILSNPKYQLSAVQKVREIQTSNRIRGVFPPYSNSGSSSTAQTELAMRRQQFINNQSLNKNPLLHQAAVSFNANFTNVNQSSSSNSFNNLHFPPKNHGTPNSVFNFNYAPLSNSGSLSGQVRNLKFVNLPFYDVKSILTPITELPSYSIQSRPGEARHQCLFGLSPEDSARLFYKSEDKPLPRFEIQLRMFQFDTSSEQQDAFPPGCIIKLDDYNVTLPNVIPTNKPSAEHKRLSRPVNITPYCQPPRPRDRPHRMVIEWNGDKRSWAFIICIVYRLNASILQERILQNGTARRSFEHIKSVIIKRLNGEDDEGIEMESIKVSLLCPLMRTRIRIPARAMDCTHLQFFDLTNYLMMCEKRPVWKCPVCDNLALYSKLIIDQYFLKVIDETDSSVEDVELLRDGSWRVVKEQVMDISDDDNDVHIDSSKSNKKNTNSTNLKSSNNSLTSIKSSNIYAHPPKLKQSTTTNRATSQNNDECEIITLSDSDDDNANINEEPSSTTIFQSATSSIDMDICNSNSNPNSNASSVSANDIILNGKHQKTNKNKTTAEKNGSNEQQQQNEENTADEEMDSSDSIICLDSDDGGEDSLIDRNVNNTKTPDDLTSNDRTPLASVAKTIIYDQNVLLREQQVKTSDSSENNLHLNSNNSIYVNRNNINNNDTQIPEARGLQNDNESPRLFDNGNILNNNLNANANLSNLSLHNVSNNVPTLPNNSAQIFCPIIKETVKAHVAQELVSFLHKICAKNSMSNSA